MNGKFKKSTVCFLVLATVYSASLPLRASGIPVVDGALATITTNQNIQTIAHWGKEISHMASQVAHYSQVINNWKTNFQNMLRSQISDFFGIQLSEKMSQAELTGIWEKGRERCNQISNITSKSYCNQMITLEIEKIKLYFEGENSIDAQWKQFMMLRERYNRAQSPYANNANELQTISEDMQKVLSKIEIDMKTYEQRIALIDTRIEWLRKARVKITQEQLQGTNRTIVDNVTKAAVAATLTDAARSSRNEAQNLRNKNRQRSQEVFQNGM